MRILALCLLLLVTGCSNYKIKEATKSVLKDPDSAIFHEISIIEDHACVTYSAKNGYGGYVGRSEMILVKVNDWWIPIESVNMNHSQCIEVIKRSIERSVEP